MLVQETGLRKDEGANAGGGDPRARSGPVAQDAGGLGHIIARQGLLKWPGHLAADRRYDHALGCWTVGHSHHRHAQPLRAADLGAYANEGDMEPRSGAAGQIGQLVGRGQSIQDGREAGIEDPFHNENDDVHGLIGIKNVNRANIPAVNRANIPADPPSTSETIMIKYALFARLEAKPGKEAAVREFLKMGLALANQESTTPIWFALKLSESTFGVFDAFENEAGRQAHLEGPIAQALMTKADELFARPPSIEPIEVLGLKIQTGAS